MDEKQLQANYYEACIYYIEQNGGLNTPNPGTLFDLEMKDGKVVIVRWRHESKKPADSTLITYTVENLTASKRRRDVLAALNTRASLRLTTAERTALGPVPDGSTIWNTTLNRLEIYHTAAWHAVAFE